MMITRVALILATTLMTLPGESAVVSRADELRMVSSSNHAAEQYMNQGAYQEARHLYLGSLPVMEKLLGPEDPASITTLANLCVASSHLRAYVDAKPICTRALALREKVLGPDHLDVARSLSDLGILYSTEGDFGRAASLFRRALGIAGSHPDSIIMPGLLNNLGFLYFQKRKYAVSEDFFARAVAAVEKDRGPEDPDLVTMLSNLGTVYLGNNQARAAEQCFRRALAIAEGPTGRDQTSSVRALVGLARAEAAQGKRSEAETFLHRAETVASPGGSGYLEWSASLEAARSALLHK